MHEDMCSLAYWLQHGRSCTRLHRRSLRIARLLRSLSVSLGRYL